MEHTMIFFLFCKEDNSCLGVSRERGKRAQNDSQKMAKVGVVIFTFNRFIGLLNALASVSHQTHKDVEIVIVNDGGTDPRYLLQDFSPAKIFHLAESSIQPEFGIKEVLKTDCKYIAFLNDDDFWLPRKLELQLTSMEATGCKMSCTDGLFGVGVYDPTKTHPRRLGENRFPRIWDEAFLTTHNNCVLASSVILHRDVIQQVKAFKQDHNSWLQALKLTHCVNVNEPLVYHTETKAEDHKQK